MSSSGSYLNHTDGGEATREKRRCKTNILDLKYKSCLYPSSLAPVLAVREFHINATITSHSTYFAPYSLCLLACLAFVVGFHPHLGVMDLIAAQLPFLIQLEPFLAFPLEISHISFYYLVSDLSILNDLSSPLRHMHGRNN